MIIYTIGKIRTFRKEVLVAKNRVQFQKGFRFKELQKQIGTEEQCRAALFRSRWPQWFRCPACDHDRFCRLSIGRYQCNACHHQPTLTAGTIFAGNKLPLATWFLAITLLTQSKNAISALELKRQLGVSYNTAWLIKHKLLQVMKERDDKRPLEGLLQIDDAIGVENVMEGKGDGALKTPPLPYRLAKMAEYYG